MRLGYYVHHHGRGHLHRFLAVRERLGAVTGLSSLPRPDGLPPEAWLELPLDTPVDPGEEASVTAHGRLHWAPTGSGGFRERMTRISAWIARTAPDGLIVDVSVEVAALGRLLGVPVIWIAQRGIREDPAHRLAYDLAELVILPWTRELDADEAGAPPPQRSVHVGAISRFDELRAPGVDHGRAGAGPPPPGGGAPDEPPRVLVLTGFGGHGIGVEEVRAAARSTPPWHWELAGPMPGAVPAEARFTVQPPGADVWSLLARAGVVIGPASGNVVAEVAAARRPLICLPQPRPFDEQGQQGRVLARAGLAEALEAWPAPAAWPQLLDRARAREVSRWELLHDGRGGERLATAVRALCG